MSKEDLARQLEQMEAQMKLLREASDEERNELENTISKLEANLKEENDVESRLARLELSLSQALENKGLPRGTNRRKSRTVWQFLNGARDKDVRKELITKGWMKDGKDSKEYDEILKIAEGVINKKKVTKVTGKVGCENQVNTVVGKSRNTTPGYVRDKRTNTKAVHSSPIGANWNCFCCKTDEHPGGWRSCTLLGKLYPDWKQGDRPPVFQQTPTR